MPKFRKKLVEIEANQFSETMTVGEAERIGVCTRTCGRSPRTWKSVAHVHTIHDAQLVELQDGDWIIPEPDGIHFYPCRPDVFAATYEPV